MAYLREWQEIFSGDCSTYEYHFWVHQYRDPGLMSMNLEAAKELAKEGEALSAAHKTMLNRIQTVHWQLMRYHA